MLHSALSDSDVDDMTCRSYRALLSILALALLPLLSLGQENSSQSLGDIARKLRKDNTEEVRMTGADTKKLFESVDRIMAFSSEDSGFPKHSAVKRRMVSKADVVQFATGRLAKEAYTQRFAQGELSMKKLGFLPRGFNLREFLVKATGQEVAGYYDDETKIISLLSWVPADRQEPVLAHELTHALQDQNYDLRKWMMAGIKPAGSAASAPDDDDGAVARKAVVEGQAMVVYVDYLLMPVGRNLANTPGLIYQMEEPAVTAVQDSQMLHDAPMILRESGTFPYKEGLIFEGELLHKGGREMAFAGAFARPPRNSHEVLQPEAYIDREKLAAFKVPDLKPVLGDEYEVYDAGGVGQLDVRAYLKQYGERRNADELSSAWLGGSYITFRHKEKSAESLQSTSDLAMLYVSRWKTPQAAAHFARFYASAIPQRYRTVTAQAAPGCSSESCPASGAHFLTEEGPVNIEVWADNSVIVTESFEATLATKVRDAVREGSSAAHAQNLSEQEIAFRLYDIPAFRQFSEEIGAEILRQMTAAQ